MIVEEFLDTILEEIGRDWESDGRVRPKKKKSNFRRDLRLDFERDFAEIWPEITIWKTSVMILEAFFDTILEEIGRVGNSFWKRFGRDLATNHYLENFCHDFGRVFRHDFGRDWESWEFILEEIWQRFGHKSLFGRLLS